MTTFEQYFLWTALPYASFLLLIAGLVWRYRSDQYGWTSRSSQWNESRILRWSSPLFHFGILFVAAGHVMGLLVPKDWTQAVGIPEHVYHLMAVIPGTAAGLMTLVGLGGLLYRRFVVTSVRLATTTNDKIMYVLLVLPICLGAWATISTQLFGGSHGYDSTARPSARGSARSSCSIPSPSSWPMCRRCSSCTSWPACCSSPSGPSPGWSTW